MPCLAILQSKQKNVNMAILLRNHIAFLLRVLWPFHVATNTGQRAENTTEKFP
jgi:hypothetical protein